MIKKLAITLAAALMIASTGCGDSKSPLLTYVARASADSIPHLFTLNEATGQATPVSIPIPDAAIFVSSNSDATAVTYCHVSDSTGTYEIFVMGLDGVEKQLTTNADACESVFSPNGKTIAYISLQSGDFVTYTMNVDGTNQTPLYAPASGTVEQFYPEFSPDGKSIVFYIELPTANASQQHKGMGTSPWLTQRPAQSRTQGHNSIAHATSVSEAGWYVMGQGDAAPTLAYATTSWWGPAVYTLDGKKLLLTMYDDTQYNVFSVNLDGSALTPLTTSTDTYNISPVPYKHMILFNRYNGDTSSWDIYAMDQTGANQALVHSTANTWETLLDSYWSGD